MQTVHLLIKGKVQGVFYRASAKEAAQRCAVNGWVKNTPDNNVEIVINGDAANVEKFIEWCKQGPFGAEVANVEVTPAKEEVYEEFTIIR